MHQRAHGAHQDERAGHDEGPAEVAGALLGRGEGRANIGHDDHVVQVALGGVRDVVGLAHAALPRRLRHDHGSVYMSDDFQKEIRFLGMESSPSFVRQPEGNGCIERFFRTVKEQLLWIRRFRDIDELRVALSEFRDRYNRSWILEKLGYRTPLQARRDFALEVSTAA